MKLELILNAMFEQLAPEIFGKSLHVNQIIGRLQENTYLIDSINTTCESDGDDFIFMSSTNNDKCDYDRVNKRILINFFKRNINKIYEDAEFNEQLAEF